MNVDVCTGDIMNASYQTVTQFIKLGVVLDILDASKAVLYPVTSSSGHFIGTITRQSVIHAIQKSPVYSNEDAAQKDVGESSKSMRLAHNEQMEGKRNWTDISGMLHYHPTHCCMQHAHVRLCMR